MRKKEKILVNNTSMRAIIQRVLEARLEINKQQYSAINQGLLVLLGIEEEDKLDDIQWLASKIVAMRIFNDQNGLMNRSLIDIDGELLLVSQFTLHASTKKGNRPSFIKAAKPSIARPLYETMIDEIEQKLGKKIKTGIFGADMQIYLCNDGPVTIIIDSKSRE